MDGKINEFCISLHFGSEFYANEPMAEKSLPLVLMGLTLICVNCIAGIDIVSSYDCAEKRGGELACLEICELLIAAPPLILDSSCHC